MQEPRDDNELKVFISSHDSRCDECGADLGHHAWITLVRDKGALCLACADLDHLVFLGSGDAALTRRARKHSTLSTVVLKWSSARKRYERQGVLVEEQALTKAEEECLADEDVRQRRRQRDNERRTELDRQYVEQFTARIRELYPLCPPDRPRQIAEHACRKYSGRVGRSASAKALDAAAVRLAVLAHVRHRETRYDRLLARGWERHDARREVEEDVREVLWKWSGQAG